MGSLEAHKSVSELYTPVSGKVRAVNEEVMDNPGLINDDPYDGGWLLEVTLEDDSELKSMMNSDEYSEYIYEAEL
jgi:glycine cleavage system H protein